MSLQMSGFEAMQRQIQRHSDKMTREKARKAVLAGAKLIASAMADAAPMLDKKTAESTSLEPGAIKADIKARAPQAQPDREAIATFGPGKKTAYAAQWVEFGHRMVKGGQSKVLSSGKTRGPGRVLEIDVPAHPFLRPAFEASVHEGIEARDAVLREGWKENG